MGLMKAVEKFDYTRIQVLNLPSWWIRQSIIRAIEPSEPFDPDLQARNRQSSHYTQKALYQEFGREPNLYEVAERLGEDPRNSPT